MLVPLDVENFLSMTGNPLTVPVSQLLHRVHQAVSSFPSTNQIRWTTKLDCLPEASLPWDNTSTLVGKNKGVFCQTINSAYPQFVPPFTFPPIRLRQVAPYRSPRKQLLSYYFCEARRSSNKLSIALTSMNHYNNYGLAPHASSPACPSGFNQSFKADRHDERASLSGSEDGNYVLYNDTHKIETDIEEEANIALTSQTLNADGTPKRPMNAFMIFARRRRPQVSSENQAMRTGEISKLLSKEWVAMPAHEKQFYLEQAKHLKDTFNSKYPDYVYRRRPNNSRKRRRSDSGLRPMDHGFMTDNADEMLGSGDLEASPIDSDDHLDTLGYTRSSHSLSQGFVDPPKYSLSHSRSSADLRSNGQFDPRMSYGPSSNSVIERFMQPLAQPRHMLQQPDLNYPYSQSQHQLQSSPFNDVAPQGWPPRTERLQSTWLGNNDREPESMNGHRQAPYSPSTPSSTWSNASPSGPTTPSASPNYFPTLNTPFYPSQPSVADYQTISSPSNSHTMATSSPLYEPASHPMMSKEYAPRVYSSTGTIQSGNSYPPPSSCPPLSYPQRNLPRVQTTIAYPNSQPSSSSSSGHGSVPPGFWSRE